MKKLFLLLATIGLIFTSCGEDNIDEPTNDNPTEKPDDEKPDDEKPDDGKDDDNAIFEIDVNGNYIIEADGGMFEITVATNIEYSVDIPQEAKSWLNVIDTRAVRFEDVLFHATANTTSEARSAVVRMLDSNNNELLSLTIIQKGVTIPSNEIWYTSNDGETVDPSWYDDNVFGIDANIVSNTYEDGKGVITFDRDITIIGENAFVGARNLTSIIIPNSVTAIGDMAFMQCYNLTDITIPNSVTTIGEDAFYGCSSLTSVTIPDSVTTIKLGAFFLCSGLTFATIPDGVTNMGPGVFAGCSSLKLFTGKFASEDGRCLIKDNTIIAYANASGTEYTIPNNVTSIEVAAFEFCNNLTNITIPECITNIGRCAFMGCSSLESIVIPNGVTEIKEDTFADCVSLKSITIPDCVTTINGDAFYNCKSLKSITLPENLQSLGRYHEAYIDDNGDLCYDYDDYYYDNPFGSCNNLEAFYGKFASDNNRCLVVNNRLISIAPAGLLSYTIPDGITTISRNAIYYSYNEANDEYPLLNSITIPASVTYIEKYSLLATEFHFLGTTPPTMEDGGIWMCYDNPTIYIPEEAVDAYLNSDWSDWVKLLIDGVPTPTLNTPELTLYSATDTGFTITWKHVGRNCYYIVEDGSNTHYIDSYDSSYYDYYNDCYYFTMNNLSAGTYTIRVKAEAFPDDCYTSSEYATITVEVGKTTSPEECKWAKVNTWIPTETDIENGHYPWGKILSTISGTGITAVRLGFYEANLYSQYSSTEMASMCVSINERFVDMANNGVLNWEFHVQPETTYRTIFALTNVDGETVIFDRNFTSAKYIPHPAMEYWLGTWNVSTKQAFVLNTSSNNDNITPYDTTVEVTIVPDYKNGPNSVFVYGISATQPNMPATGFVSYDNEGKEQLQIMNWYSVYANVAEDYHLGWGAWCNLTFVDGSSGYYIVPGIYPSFTVSNGIGTPYSGTADDFTFEVIAMDLFKVLSTGDIEFYYQEEGKTYYLNAGEQTWERTAPSTRAMSKSLSKDCKLTPDNHELNVVCPSLIIKM